MDVNFKTSLLLSLLLIMLSFIINCQHETSLQPELSCIDDQLVVDTTRVYFRTAVDVEGSIVLLDTIPIYPQAIFARFYPWVTDTITILLLLEKHNLKLHGPLSGIKQQLSAILCVPENRRAEYYFTPYGKDEYCNFGADSLVEYAFGIFAYGFGFPTGEIVFKFTEETPQARIDSLFDAFGLRFLIAYPDIPSGKRYLTLVSPSSKKNVLDIISELNQIPFVIYASADWATVGGNPPIRCDE